jgi:hypothetical protein
LTAAPSPDERMVRDLAQLDDWRERVDALALSEDEAHVLRVRILRARAFGAAQRGAANASRRGRPTR